MYNKYWITAIVALLILSLGQWYFYNLDRQNWISETEKILVERKEKNRIKIDSLVKAAESIRKESEEQVQGLLKKNYSLNRKIWNYENNPDFNDYDFLERATNVANYKYRQEK